MSFVAFFGVALGLRATSVTPPSFTELVGEADAIARVTVTSVESRWVDTAQAHVIKTFVTFSVDHVLKGAPANPLTLEFLGGTVGADAMRVAGMPQFQTGQHEIVFVQGNGVQFCPLVRFGHGRYHVRTDARSKRSFVTRNNGAPLAAPADVQLPAEDAAATASAASADTAITPEQFESAIAAQVAHQTK